MLYIGIDIASKKHDCCIIGDDSTVLTPIFTFENNAEGYDVLLKTIRGLCRDFKDVKVGVESTGHYSNNIIAFLRGKGFNLTVFNPLQVNLFRKAQTLRKTKTDKVDARFLALMLMTTEQPVYVPQSLEISELKVLVRHRTRLVSMRTKLKISVSRLVAILFPELQSAVCSIHQATSYALLLEMPTAKAVADCHLTRLANLLYERSKHRYGKDKAIEIKTLAAKSIGQDSFATGLELQQTIRILMNLRSEIDILDKQVKALMLKINSPILTIPGISYTLGSIILAEIGNIDNFSNPGKLLAFAGLEPSTHQSGRYSASNTPMVKRGSSYLRWAVLQAALLVAIYDPSFKAYAAKKNQEGKHHFVVMSHVGRKLVRVIFHLLKNNVPFAPVA
jgi:transposase